MKNLTLQKTSIRFHVRVVIDSGEVKVVDVIINRRLWIDLFTPEVVATVQFCLRVSLVPEISRHT